MMTEKTDILTALTEELKRTFEEAGEKGFRAKQVYEWLHVHHVPNGKETETSFRLFPLAPTSVSF